MRYLIISLLAFTFLTGCDEAQKKEKKMRIFGAMAVQNKTSTMLDVSIVPDGNPIDFGILVADATKSMGGGRFELGKELKVVWFEDYDTDNPTKGEAFFDTTKFADIVDRIKEVEFIYVGNKKWKMRAYKALHRYDKDLLREIGSN